MGIAVVAAAVVIIGDGLTVVVVVIIGSGLTVVVAVIIDGVIATERALMLRKPRPELFGIRITLEKQRRPLQRGLGLKFIRHS